MNGKRHDLPEDEFNLAPGEYGITADGYWLCRAPGEAFTVGTLTTHQVTEHSDGTISVYPSILCYGDDGSVWHGYLTRGDWDELDL
jgi:hypothetical protein